MLVAILICGASVFTSCSNDDNPVIEPDLGVAEKIIGKWMSAEINGKPFPTDNKGVYTFLTTTTARMSSSVNSRPELGDLWHDLSELDVNITGNVVTLTHQLDEHKTMTIEMTVTSINAEEMHADVHAVLTVDGAVAGTVNDHILYEKIKENYRESIQGLWEGQSTGDAGSEFDDGENHRWEYLADGTFHYYHKVNGQWQLSDDEFAEYFVDGTLLCTRWKNAGAGNEENREWWEIESIENGVMKWKALRKNADGSTYTATFEMKKVDVPTQEEIEQKIIGKWMNAELTGQPVLTNQKMVMNFISSTKAFISASFNDHPETGDGWYDLVESDVAINGNKMTMANPQDQYAKVVSEFTISAINDKEFTAIQKLTVIIDGKIQDSHELPIRFVKVEKDYSADIIGMWEGHSTGAEGSEFDDGENHRWEYMTDGTFNYFRKVDGQWQISDDDYAKYFVAGNLLCTRWKNAGEGNEENREWWEIESIKDGVMKWKALRQNADGTTYTATFEMKKVTE